VVTLTFALEEAQRVGQCGSGLAHHGATTRTIEVAPSHSEQAAAHWAALEQFKLLHINILL
jgi:hypothetical protein